MPIVFSFSFSGNHLFCFVFRENFYLMGRSGIFDLEKHFAFYGAYHNNPVNILIHTLFVWPILFTLLVPLYFTPALFDFPSGFDFGHGLVLNLGFVFTVIYAVFYVLLDKKAGSLAAFLCFLCWVGSSFLAQRLGFSLAWKVSPFFIIIFINSISMR